MSRSGFTIDDDDQGLLLTMMMMSQIGWDVLKATSVLNCTSMALAVAF
jgi:hypothetical protein